MRQAYLKRDQNEMRTSKRIYWKPCWRIVDKKGNDVVVPWPWTKKEARETCKALNITIIGELA